MVPVSNNGNHEQPVRGVIIATIPDGKQVIPAKEIVRLQSARAYTYIFTKDKGRFIVSKNLTTVLKELCSKTFCRSHRQHAFNLNELKTFDVERRGIAKLRDDSIVPVSQRMKSHFLGSVKNFFGNSQHTGE